MTRVLQPVRFDQMLFPRTFLESLQNSFYFEQNSKKNSNQILKRNFNKLYSLNSKRFPEISWRFVPKRNVEGVFSGLTRFLRLLLSPEKLSSNKKIAQQFKRHNNNKLKICTLEFRQIRSYFRYKVKSVKCWFHYQK